MIREVKQICQSQHILKLSMLRVRFDSKILVCANMLKVIHMLTLWNIFPLQFHSEDELLLIHRQKVFKMGGFLLLSFINFMFDRRIESQEGVSEAQCIQIR